MKTILLLGAKSSSTPLESVPAELSRLKEHFKQSSLDFHIEYEPYLTQDSLAKLLRQHIDNTAILHFAGHSNEQQLLTNDSKVYSHHIADLLKTSNKPPQLVFLNGCRSAAQVTELLQAGVACVIATHKAINDQEAMRFANEFYTNLLSNPDRVSFKDAFKRAGSVVLMGEPRRARSMDIKSNAVPPQDWDWGLYCQGSENEQSQLLQARPHFPEFMRQKKYEMAENRWQLLFEKLTLLQTDYDLETRTEEKLRLKHVITQIEADLAETADELERIKA